MVFRVTNQFFNNESIRNIQNNFNELTRLQNSLTTLKKFEKPSEDPISANQAILLDRNIREVQQYKTNVETGSEFLNHSDQVVAQIRELVAEAQAKASQGLNATTEPEGRQAIAAELESILNQVISISNSSLAGRFVFAGHENLTKPFSQLGTDVLFHGDNENFKVNVFGNESIQANLTPDGVFGALQTTLLSEKDLNAKIGPLSLGTTLPAGTLTLQEGQGLDAGTLAITVTDGMSLSTLVDTINTQARTKATTAITDAASAAVTAYQAQGGSLTLPNATTITQAEIQTAITGLSGVDEVEQAITDFLNQKYTTDNTTRTPAHDNAISAAATAGRKSYSAHEFSAVLSREGLQILHDSGRKISIVEGDANSVDLYAALDLPGQRSSKSHQFQATITGAIATDQTLTISGKSSASQTVSIRKGDSLSVIARRINRAVNGTGTNAAFHKMRASVSQDPNDGTTKLKIISDQSFSVSGVTELSSGPATEYSSLKAHFSRIETLRDGVGLGVGSVKLEADNATGYSSDIAIRAGDSLDFLITQLNDLAGFEASLNSTGKGIDFRSVARYSTQFTPDNTQTLSITQTGGATVKSFTFANTATVSEMVEIINAGSSTTFRFNAEVDSTGSQIVLSSNELFSVSDASAVSIASTALNDLTSSTVISSTISETLGLTTTMATDGLVSGEPLLTRQTRISELNGGSGATMGKIAISVNNATAVEIDLSSAVTLRDVKDLIEAALPNQVTVGLNSNLNGLELKTTDSTSMRVSELSGGSTARQLGLIATPASSATGSIITGADINPVALSSTLLRDYHKGEGVDLTGFKIKNGSHETTINFDSDSDGVVDIVDAMDLVNEINNKSSQDNVYVQASIDASTGKIKLASQLSNSSLQVEEITQSHKYYSVSGLSAVPAADTTMTILNAAGDVSTTVSIAVATDNTLQLIVDKINEASLNTTFNFEAKLQTTYNAAGAATATAIVIESDEAISVNDTNNTNYFVTSKEPFERDDFGTTASDLGLLGAFSDSTLLSTLNGGAGFTPGTFFVSYGSLESSTYTVNSVKAPTAGAAETLTLYNENGSISATVTMNLNDTIATLETNIEAAATAAGLTNINVEQDTINNVVRIVSTGNKITATNSNTAVTNNTTPGNIDTLTTSTAKKITVNLSEATTLGDVKRTIESESNNEITVGYGRGNRIELTLANNDVNQTIKIEESSAASDTAQSLGLIGTSTIRGHELRDGTGNALTNATLLSELGLTFNQSPATGSTENHLVLVSGSDSASIDLKSATTIGDVLSAINAVSTSDQGNALDFNAQIFDGRYILINNTQGTATNVVKSEYSDAAEKLGLIPDPSRSSNVFYVGNDLNPNHLADNFFSGITTIISEFQTGAADPDTVTTAITMLERMESRFLTSRAEAGARINRFDSLMVRFEDEEINLKEQLGKRVEVDIIEATQQFLQQQQVYQSGLSSVSRVLGLSLFDFI